MPAIFRVRPAFVQATQDWLRRQNVPSVRSSGIFMPSITAWAILDGGITSTQQYGLTSLPSGLRVFGWQALTLLSADLGVALPTRVMPGQPGLFDATDLQQRHAMTGPEDADGVARAEALAGAGDYESLRWVIRALFGDGALSADRNAHEPARGAWGDAHFTEGAAALLKTRMTPEEATIIGQKVRTRFVRNPEKAVELHDFAQVEAFDEDDAALILKINRIGVDRIQERVDSGSTIREAMTTLRRVAS